MQDRVLAVTVDPDFDRDSAQWRGECQLPTELTPEGEQTVIPGCERNVSPKATQLDLFG